MPRIHAWYTFGFRHGILGRRVVRSTWVMTNSLGSIAPHETRIGVMEEGRVVELMIERRKNKDFLAISARPRHALPGMQAAFVDIGLERAAFLTLRMCRFATQSQYSNSMSKPETRVFTRRFRHYCTKVRRLWSRSPKSPSVPRALR